MIRKDHEGEGANVVFRCAVHAEEILIQKIVDVVGVPEVECGVCVEDWGELGEEGFAEVVWREEVGEGGFETLGVGRLVGYFVKDAVLGVGWLDGETGDFLAEVGVDHVADFAGEGLGDGGGEVLAVVAGVGYRGFEEWPD